MTSSPASPSHDDDDDDLLAALRREGALQDASGVVVAGLLGAALGAGLGWLASRSVASRSGAGGARSAERGAEPSATRSTPKTWPDGIVAPAPNAAREAVRGTTRDRKRGDARAGETVDDVATVVQRTAAALERSRADVERQLERGLRDLRRAARRAARRIG